jgi:hypothetical protein
MKALHAVGGWEKKHRMKRDQDRTMPRELDVKWQVP